MTFLQRLMGNLSVNDERAWTPNFGGVPTTSGELVGYNTALTISTYYACVGLISDVVAMLPKHIKETMPDNTKRLAKEHYLYNTIHNEPNDDQTSFEFFGMMQLYATQRNNAHAIIKPGPSGPFDQLVPVHPDNIKQEKIYGGGYRYSVKQTDNTWKPYNKEDILHIRGLQQEMIKGMDLLPLMQESIGLSIASRKYSSRFYANDAQPGGVLMYDKQLSDEALRRLKASWYEAQGGANRHKVAILENGLKFEPNSTDPRAAQYNEREEFQANDMCRFFRVPPSIIGLPSKATSWAGTGIEQQAIGFVQYCILPWITRWQQTLSKYLIVEPDRFYVDFVVDGLLRGDSLTRYNVYRIARELGVLNPNEIRRLENMDPREDEGGDKYVDDMGRSMAPAQAEAEPMSEPTDDDMEEDMPMDEDNAHYRRIVHEAAMRVIRKETLAMGKAAKRGKDWAVDVHNFYGEHVSMVAETMAMPLAYARQWCEAQEQELTARGPECMSDWETRRVGELERMAIG